MIGMAKVDLTPDPGKMRIRLNGYANWSRRQPATGILDRLWARALVTQDDRGGLFALASMDLCYIGQSLRDQVLELLADQGFTSANVILAATHTHSSFSGYDRSFIARALMGPYRPELFEQTAAGIAEAILKAKKALGPGSWSLAQADLEGMNRSRLDPAFEFGDDDSVDRPQPDPEKFPVDPRLSVLHLKSEEGRTIGAVIHFASHPTILSPKNMELSGDYPGVLLDRVEQSLGENCVALFINNTLGDTAPTPDWTDSLAEEIEMMNDYGNKFADIVIDLLTKVEPIDCSPISYKLTRRSFQDVIVRALGRRLLPLWLSKVFYERPELPFQAVRLGKLMLLAVPGEATTKIGELIRAECPADAKCLVIAPANGFMGYLVTPQQYDDGGYAADSCYFGPETGLKVVEAMKQTISLLAEEDNVS